MKNRLERLLWSICTLIAVCGCTNPKQKNTGNINIQYSGDSTFVIRNGPTNPFKAYELLLKAFSDSIIQFDTSGIVPIFLRDTYLDINYRMSSFHVNESIRKRLIDSITNVNLLNAIIDSKDPIYQQIPSELKPANLPFEDMSTMELILIRKKEIEEQQKR
jgi:hypothetical protein